MTTKSTLPTFCRVAWPLPGRELSKMSEDCDAKVHVPGCFASWGDAAAEQVGLKMLSDVIVCMK